MAQAIKTSKNNGANVGYEAELWQMADALRGSMAIIEADLVDCMVALPGRPDTQSIATYSHVRN